MRLARKLRLYISVENLTAKIVSAEIGVNESTISRFISGKGMPDADGLVKIAAWCFAHEAVPQTSIEETPA